MKIHFQMISVIIRDDDCHLSGDLVTTLLGQLLMSRLRLTCLTLLLMTLAVAASAQAQADIALSALKVELWPEFDQPVMLVILEGVLKPDVPLPAMLTMDIPVAPTAVAMMDATGRLLTAPATTAPAGDKIAVTLTTDYSTFRVEYYDPALSFNASTRENGNKPLAPAPSKIINAPSQFCAQCGSKVLTGDAFAGTAG